MPTHHTILNTDAYAEKLGKKLLQQNKLIGQIGLRNRWSAHAGENPAWVTVPSELTMT